jgi:hypothetical protein
LTVNIAFFAVAPDDVADFGVAVDEVVDGLLEGELPHAASSPGTAMRATSPSFRVAGAVVRRRKECNMVLRPPVPALRPASLFHRRRDRKRGPNLDIRPVGRGRVSRRFGLSCRTSARGVPRCARFWMLAIRRWSGPGKIS